MDNPEWSRLIFDEKVGMFPYAPAPTRRFIEIAIQEEADKLERHPFPQMSPEAWLRRVNFAHLYWDDPLSTLSQTGRMNGTTYAPIRLALVKFVGYLWMNCEQNTQDEIAQHFPLKSFDITGLKFPTLPIGKIRN